MKIPVRTLLVFFCRPH